MVGIGGVERGFAQDRGYDGLAQSGLRIGLGLFCSGLLPVTVGKNRGAVAIAAVAELPARVRRINRPEEHRQQLVRRHHRRIILDLRRFIVPGAAGDDLFIGGVFHASARKTRYDLFHALNAFKVRFNAPKAAARDQKRLCSGGFCGCRLCCKAQTNGSA